MKIFYFYLYFILHDEILYSYAVILAQTELRTFNILDQRMNNAYFDGLYEHHCFNIDTSNNRNYVRGTYGAYGYFEGSVDPLNSYLFHINWYETSLENMYGSSGSGVLNYSKTWDQVSGRYWNGVTDDLNSSYGPWLSSNGTHILFDLTVDDSNVLLRKCLYPGINHERIRNSVPILQDLSITSSGTDGLNTFCRAPARGYNLWFGTYKYHYLMDRDGFTATEYGNYGMNSIGFLIKSGIGFVGEWKANTGPFAGDHGTTLYILLGTTSKVVVVGFYCFIESLSRTQCEREYYEIVVDKQTKEYQNGINSCPKFYRQDDSFQQLYDYVANGYQHNLQCNEKSSSVPWIIASIFIIFSVILIFTFLYIMILFRGRKSASISP